MGSMDFWETVLADKNEQRRENKLFGLYTAKVTGLMGGGFELSYLGMGGNAPSAPARVMMPGAGKQRGAYFMPDVGDEVVVAFEGGDSNMPIILGGVWNSESPMPDQAKPSQDNNVRTLVSRSGHEISLDDTSGKEQIRCKSKGGLQITLDDTTPGKITIQSKLGVKIVLDDTPPGQLTLEAPLSLTLTSPAIVLQGSVSTAPVPPVPGLPPTPPTPTEIASPLQVTLKSPLVSIQGDAAVSIQSHTGIAISTTGLQATSGVVIDGVPWQKVALVP